MKNTALTAKQLEILSTACDILQDLVPTEKVDNWTFEDTQAYKAWSAIMDVISSTPHEA